MFDAIALFTYFSFTDKPYLFLISEHHLKPSLVLNKLHKQQQQLI